MLREWQKLRRSLLALAVVYLLTDLYLLLQLHSLIVLRGRSELYSLIVDSGSTFVEASHSLPLLLGLLLSLAQFVPELQQRRLKLTLHLPYPQTRLLLTLLGTGLALVGGLLLLHLALFAGVFAYLLPWELCLYLLSTIAVQLFLGLSSYLLGSWICLEPSWSRRIPALIVSAAYLYLYFFTDQAAVYTRFYLLLAALLLLLPLLPMLAIAHFRRGEQDR